MFWLWLPRMDIIFREKIKTYTSIEFTIFNIVPPCSYSSIKTFLVKTKKELKTKSKQHLFKSNNLNNIVSHGTRACFVPIIMRRTERDKQRETKSRKGNNNENTTIEVCVLCYLLLYCLVISIFMFLFIFDWFLILSVQVLCKK